jgi:hypothetical protein
MKLTIQDVDYVRDLALEMIVKKPTPIYLNNTEVPDRTTIPVCYVAAVIAMLEKHDLLKQKIELNLNRTNADGVNDI